VLDGLASLVDDSLNGCRAELGWRDALSALGACAPMRRVTYAADGRLEGRRRHHAEHYLEVALRSGAEIHSRNIPWSSIA
jgi:hypothetical protein